MGFETEQEEFWAGEFGADYVARNKGSGLLASNIAFFSRALRVARPMGHCMEFGANIGMNLRALKLLFPDQDQHALEINAAAAAELATVIPRENIIQESILNFSPTRTYDLVLTKGLLIHLSPDVLPRIYETLFRATGRYLLICEYYNPRPVRITYRGHSDRLFKRDFCGEFLDLYESLQLLDYGFCYHRDPKFPQDDVTWFLLEKRS